jgi:cupin fold WbuC family metalloprotein
VRALELALPPGIVREGPEVFYSCEPVVAVSPALIGWLKAQASATPRKRSRLCAHAGPSAAVHEMIIVLHRDVYVRPHRHTSKSESFHRIEGEAWIVLFDERGAIDDVLALDASSNAPFFFRIPAEIYHAFLIRSDWLAFHETTAGPFERSQMEFASWSPDESDPKAVALFSEQLERDVQSFLFRDRTRSEWC